MKITGLVVVFAILAGCRAADATLEPTQIPAAATTAAPTATFTETASPSPTETPLPTNTPTPPPSTTSTPSPPPSLTPTPTSEFPLAVVIEERAFCRYGPGKAYLYSHELNKGETAEVHGRTPSKNWLWIKPVDLERHCWAAASVVEVNGDIALVNVVTSRLPQSTLYGPPDDVEADRDGDTVTISWEEVWMTQDDFRGYLVEATVCQGGGLVFVAIQTDGTSIELTDEGGCSGSSGGKVYAVEKHGYTDSIDIPWPD
jgi:hypothetical protein